MVWSIAADNCQRAGCHAHIAQQGGHAKRLVGQTGAAAAQCAPATSVNWCSYAALIALFLCASIVPAADNVPAFPGAEGFGAQSIGGRGGRVIEVTTLDDAGPGSLRAAVEAEGPRIVVFRVSGTIELMTELVVKHPYITIAGQTAPGGGITLKTHAENPRSALTVKEGAHDVVIRYLRIRPGPSKRQAVPGDESHIKDGLQILDARRVIVDHCSMSWATDEVVSTFSSAEDVTIQWCIISEALRNTERGGPDGKGLLLGGPRAHRISAHHNLLAHNFGRNPMVKSPGVIDIVNNVVLSPAKSAMVVDGEFGTAMVNIVGNYVMAPDADGAAWGVRRLAARPVGLFVQGNLGPHRTDSRQAEELFVDPGNSSREYLSSERFEAPSIITLPAEEALAIVLEQAGCTRPLRDAVDERIIADVQVQRAKLITDPVEVGGWPTLASGEAPADEDHDAMPDAWEVEQRLNPRNAADGPADADGDGYTNVEEFLNGTDPRKAEVPAAVN